MGCWGMGIFDDDLAMDIKDLYDDLVSKDYKDNQVTRKILELYKDSIEDEDDSIIIYSALAAIQLSRSSLLDEIKSKTTLLIDKQSGMSRWKEAGKESLKKRQYVLNKLKRILSRAIASESIENALPITQEYNKPLTCSVYELSFSGGQVSYIGSTAFPEKRFRYMNYINLKQDHSSKGFFNLFGSSKSKEEEFWEWFSQNEHDLFKVEGINAPCVEELYKRIKKIHPDLTFEFSPEFGGKKTMAISANGISELFPYVIRLSNEPKLLTRWIVVPFRQRLKNGADFELRIGDVLICDKDIFFISFEADKRLDLDIFIKGIENVDNAMINAVFLVLDSVIGEYDVTSKIGKIEVKPYSSLNDGEKAQGLSRLPEIVDQMK